MSNNMKKSISEKMNEKVEKNSKGKIILIMIIVLVLVAFLGTTYAWYIHYEETSSRQLVAGDIYLNLTEYGNQIQLSNVYPLTVSEARALTNNYIIFEVSGENGYDKDLYYEILLKYGSEVTDENIDYERFNDDDLRFDLIEVNSNNEEVNYIFTNRNYSSIDGQRIHVDKADAESPITKRYKLRMWIGDDVTVSDTDPNAEYTATGENAFKNHYASVKVAVMGDFTYKGTTQLYDTIKVGAVIDNENNAEKYINNTNPGINFGAISSDTNGKGVYLRAGTQSTDYPIYYYRGAVTNNNVYFANYCWKIVRTTETGGIKLVYNGQNTGTAQVPKCENTTGNATLMNNTTYQFNTHNQSPAYVGYMYGDHNEWSSGKETDGAYFGTGFTYAGGVYTLKNAKVGIDSDHHYTCNSTSSTGTCASIRYYYYYNPEYSDANNRYMYITLTGGDGVLDFLDKAQINTNSSNAKTQIDTWYATYMRSYTNKLEDTIWCNDRGIYQLGGWNESGGSLIDYLYFDGIRRRDAATKVPNLGCNNQNDAFTVSNKKGNKALTYPVALLTMDEIMLAGAWWGVENNSYYLYNGTYQWSLSPFYFYVYGANEFSVYSTGYLHTTGVANGFGLRPSVSLRPGTMVDRGDGTSTSPYIVS